MSAERADRTQAARGVYLVTDRVQCGDRGVVETVRQAVDAGVTTVQLRDKDATDAEILACLRELAPVTAGRAVLVVDDRLDAVVAARRERLAVDGVHLGQSDTSVAVARAALGPDAVVGLTADRPEHLEALAKLPAGTVDYLGVGAIHPTATKADAPEALGVAGFADFVAAAPLPCVAIGGVKIADVAPLRAAGACGVAVVSAICAADDARAAAAELVAEWESAESAEDA